MPPATGVSAPRSLSQRIVICGASCLSRRHQLGGVRGARERIAAGSGREQHQRALGAAEVLADPPHPGVRPLEDVDPLEAIGEHGLHPLERLQIRIDHDQARGRLHGGRRRLAARTADGGSGRLAERSTRRAAASASASRAASTDEARRDPGGRRRAAILRRYLFRSLFRLLAAEDRILVGRVRLVRRPLPRRAKSGADAGPASPFSSRSRVASIVRYCALMPVAQRQLEVARFELVAHLEAELARAPGEHAQHGALDVLAAQRVDALGRESGVALERLVERHARSRCDRSRARLEGRRRHEAAAHQQGLQILGLALHEGAAHLPVVQDDATLAGVGAQDEQTGFAGEAHDLKDVPESQVLEASHQAHSNPRQGRAAPRVSRAATGARRPLLHRLQETGSAGRAVT